MILIQVLALKIYDEKHHKPLHFYITNEEENYHHLSNDNVQNFIKRIEFLMQEASGNYRKILKAKELDFSLIY